MRNLKIGMLLTTVATLMAGTAYAAEWYPFEAAKIEPPFAVDGKSVNVSYVPLEKASKMWNICFSFPHMKDAYWLGVDYGVVEEAKREGIKANILEAGGYTEVKKQIAQIEDCIAGGAQAVVVGAISSEALNPTLAQIHKKNIPVVLLVNDTSSADITAKSKVSFFTMGATAGEYLAKKHPAGSPEVLVGWFPGPAGASWVEDANKGFLDAVKGSAVKVLPPKFGDTGKEVQQKLVEDALQSNPDIRYVAGNAVMAEAAQGIVRERGLQGKVDILSFYVTPGVYEGIKRGTVLAAPADSMVIQGRFAVDQAVRILEGKDYIKDVGPKIFVMDPSNIKTVAQDTILPPTAFKPVFKVN